MTAKSRRQLQALTALGISLAAHAGALTLPAHFSSPLSHADYTAMEVHLAPPEIPEPKPEPVPQPPPEDEVRLGLNKPLPLLPSWIGYEEYLEHFAKKSELDQAAFEDQPLGNLAEVNQLPQPAPLAPSTEAAPEEVAAAKPEVVPPKREQSEPTPAAERVQPPLARAPAQEPLRPADVVKPESTQQSPPKDATIPPPPSPNDTPREDEAKPEEKPEEKPTEQPKDAPPTDASQPQDSPSPTQPQPAPPSTPADLQAAGVPVPGERADKQSDPTSIIDVPADNWKLGKPLAGRGLELRPKRPVFTTLVLLTAGPRNPLCEIRFRSDGVPASAKLLVSSGDTRVDDAVLSSLYRWRAAGDKLAKLPPKQTLPVRIRLILVNEG